MSRWIVGSRAVISTRSGLWNDPCSTGGRLDAQPENTGAATAARTRKQSLSTTRMAASIRKPDRDRVLPFWLMAVAAATLLLSSARGVADDENFLAPSASDNVVLQWDNSALDAIRRAPPGPTVVSRAIAVLHTCMFDAWAAYDATAVATAPLRGWRRPASERTDANKAQAV